MNSDAPFVIGQFTNPSGEIVFRVSGYLAGNRVRKNFRTRAEAEAERQVLEIQREQTAAGLQRVFTRLNQDQVQDAEAAVRRLGESTHTLLFCVEYTLLNYRAPQQDKPMVEAIADYVAAKAREHERTLLSLRQMLSIKFELGHLSRRFQAEMVAQVTPAKIIPYLERGKPSLKTYNNRRGLISTFFKFAAQKDWIATNPVEKTPYFRVNHRRGSAVTITAEKTAELMAFVETFENGALVPYFAICLFAGIRPCIRYGEITKLSPVT